MKKTIVSFSAVVLAVVLMAQGAHAFRLLTREEGLKEVFGSEAKITSETKALSGAKLAAVKKRLGGNLFYHKAGAAEDKITFHVASRGDKKTGIATLNVQPGKWGPVEFLVALDLSGKVTKVVVLSCEEKRGRPIVRSSFLGQYTGKTSKNKLLIGDDITGISGATVSSEAASFAVKKAIVVYEELYLK